MQRDVYRRYGWNGWWINWKPKILGHQKWPGLYKQEGSCMVPHVCNTLLNVTGLETDINLGFITYICTHSHKHPSSGEYLFILVCAGSSLLHRLFSSCGKQVLLSSYSTHASHWDGFSSHGAQALRVHRLQ